MRRKLLTIILVFLGLGFIVFSILLFLGVFKPDLAGLEIDTDPQSKIFINGQEVGITPYELNREPGEITLRIKPIEEKDQILDDYETKLTLAPGIKTIVKRSFKTNDEETSGAIVSFEKTGGNESYVTVVSVPDNAVITLDGKVYGYAPIRIKIPAGDHQLIVSAENYLEKSLPIRVFKGYKLTASVKLSKKPDIKPPPEAVLSETSKATEQIEILPNDMGYLRVRSGPGLNNQEIAQVKPGEKYDVYETSDSGWYKIKVNNDEGWVSKEFVKLLTVQSP